MPHDRLSVRALDLKDIPHIVSYWTTASQDFLERMGADANKVLPSEQLTSNLRKLYETPEREAKTFYMIWQVNDEAIGYSCLKNISYGKSGEMHLHMWNADFRGKGYGGRLFCLSALEFFRRFELKQIHCEPRSSNPFPNGMMRKVGFPLIKTHVAASSELSLVCELNRYDIRREIAESYLSSSVQKHN